MPIDPSFLVTGGGLRGPLFREAPAEPDPGFALPAGTRVGAYEVVDLIGRGGMSSVYRARRCDGAFDQLVALKIARGTAAFRERALRERDILAKLQHPFIARIYDAGETADGSLWIAMELVHGRRIDHYVIETSCSWRERLVLLRNACDAVHHAHELLVLHRDIKPSNVLVSDDGHLKLVDFGIAHDAGSDEQRAAQASDRSCTPSYGSPEQLGGAPVGIASDIYQLGLVIEDLLLRRLPRSATNGTNAESAEHDRGPERRRLPPLVRMNLEALVAKSLRLDPRARHASALELCADLDRVATYRPVRAKRWSPIHRARFLVQRNRLFATLSGAFIVLLVLLGAQLLRTETNYREIRFREAQDAESGRAFLSHLLMLDRPGGAQKGEDRILDVLDRGARQTTLMSSDPRARVNAVGAVADAYFNMGARDRALALVQQTQDEFDQKHSERLLERARLATMTVKYSEAIGFLRLPQTSSEAIAKAEALFKAAGATEGIAERMILGRAKVIALNRLNRMDDALALADRIVREAEKADAVDSLPFAALLLTRGMVRWARNYDASGTRADLERALPLFENLTEPASFDQVLASATLAQALAASGDYDRAARLLDEMLRTASSNFGEDSTQYARALGSIGLLEINWGGSNATAPALARLEKAFRLLRASNPEQFYTHFFSYTYAMALNDSGRFEEALALLQRISQEWRKEFVPGHSILRWVDLELANAQCGQGDATGALERLAQIEHEIPAGPNRAQRLTGVLVWRANCLARIGRNADAAASLREVSNDALARYPTRLREAAARLRVALK